MTTPQDMLYKVYYSVGRMEKINGEMDEKIDDLTKDFKSLEASLNRVLVLLERKCDHSCEK